MRAQHGNDEIGRPSRRTLARGVAWTVPAVAVGAAAPAMAASPSGTGNLTSSCTATPTQQASFTLAVTGYSGSSVQVQFVGTNVASISVTAPLPAGWTLLAGSTATTRTYDVTVSGGSAGGTIVVNLNTIDGNKQGTVTATILTTGLIGDTSETVRILRTPPSTFTCVAP